MNKPRRLPPLLAQTTQEFPWRTGHTVELLINGDQFFPPMLRSMELAKHRIWIEIYLVASGKLLQRFIKVWCDAALRGVDVRLCYDDVGSRDFHEADQQRLMQAGVQLACYNPRQLRRPLTNFLRDHRKLILIDEDTVYIGGTGFSDDFSPELNHAHWRETLVAVHGPVALDWELLFLNVWRHNLTHPVLTAAKSYAGHTTRSRINASQADFPGRIQAHLVVAMRHAKERIWLATPYFIPPRRLRKALRRAVQRGVDVRLLIPGEHSDHPWLRLFSQGFYPRLLHHGIKIYEYQPRFLHMKVMLCDNWVSVGSSNLDRWGMFWNLEANQEFYDPQLASSVQNMLIQDFSESSQIEVFRPQRWSLQLRLLLQGLIRHLERWRLKP